MRDQATSSRPNPAPPLRQRLRDALTTAIKSRDRVAITALRSALAAIDNAEAVDRPSSVDRNLSIEMVPIGAGATEVARRVLTETQVEQIVRAELIERRTALHAYEEAGKGEHAERLRGEIEAISQYVEAEAAAP